MKKKIKLLDFKKSSKNGNEKPRNKNAKSTKKKVKAKNVRSRDKETNPKNRLKIKQAMKRYDCDGKGRFK